MSANFYETVANDVSDDEEKVMNNVEYSGVDYETSAEEEKNIQDFVFFVDPESDSSEQFTTEAQDIEVSTYYSLNDYENDMNNGSETDEDVFDEELSGSGIESLEIIESGSSDILIVDHSFVTDDELEDIIKDMRNETEEKQNISILEITEVRQFVSDISERADKSSKDENTFSGKNKSSSSCPLILHNLSTSSTLVIISAVVFLLS